MAKIGNIQAPQAYLSWGAFALPAVIEFADVTCGKQFSIWGVLACIRNNVDIFMRLVLN